MEFEDAYYTETLHYAEQILELPPGQYDFVDFEEQAIAVPYSGECVYVGDMLDDDFLYVQVTPTHSEIHTKFAFRKLPDESAASVLNLLKKCGCDPEQLSAREQLAIRAALEAVQ